MLTIKLKITKQHNASYYNRLIDDIIEIPFEEYLRGVVSAEIGAYYPEACKAQAVASRTFAYPYVSADKVITDSSASHQAFRASLMYDETYATAHQAVKDTEGEMLYYDNKIVSPCSFSSCNYGHTTSSEERWGGHRPYLIQQIDPWDEKANYSMKRGHGVGMSQIGARYAAKQGVSYRDILSFYYPGTCIKKEGSPMAQVKASDLIVIFNQMADEKWKYVAGAHKTGEVDCSGAFYYAYKKLGCYMYHGSNTMYRNYTVRKNKIGSIELKPGMAVFKRRDWTSSQSSNGWYETDPGDMYHVGMYVGDGWVVEAQGKKTGVVRTKISTWHYAAELKDTVYDVTEGQTIDKAPFVEKMGIVQLNSGYLNLRTGPDTSRSSAAKVYDGCILTIIGEQNNWYEVNYGGKTLYASKQYVQLCSETTEKQYAFKITVPESEVDNVKRLLSKYVYTLEAVGDVA